MPEPRNAERIRRALLVCILASPLVDCGSTPSDRERSADQQTADRVSVARTSVVQLADQRLHEPPERCDCDQTGLRWLAGFGRVDFQLHVPGCDHYDNRVHELDR